MKQMKRTVGLLLALVLALTLALPAWAAGYVPPATCTVYFGGAADIMPAMLAETTPDQTEREWVGYRLLDLDVSQKQDATGNHTLCDGTAHTKDCYNYAYHVRTDAAALTNILVTQADAYKAKVEKWEAVGDPAAKPEVTADNLVQFMEKISDTEARDFADAVYRAIKENTAITLDMTAAQYAGEFAADVDQGYWLFADVTNFADKTEKVNSLVVLATKGDANVTVSPKTSLPTVDKKASATETGTPQEEVSVNVGDTVYFTLTGTLPNHFLNYAKYKYVFHDTLSTGLTYTADSAKVYLVKDGTETQLTTGFTAAYDDATRKLTVTFNDLRNVQAVTDAYKQDSGIKLLVKYSAALGEGALNTNAEHNRAYLEYANDPYSIATGQTTEDQVNVYDFDLVIDKYDKDSTGTKLAGAEFILYKEENGAKSYYQRDETNKKVSWVTAETDATKYETDDQGAARFTGLAAGTYYLKEIKAPAGYNLVKEAKKVEIAKQAADDGVTAQLTRTVQVENSSGTVLPSTGGMGTVIFYALGAAMVLGAVALLARRRQPDSAGK